MGVKRYYRDLHALHSISGGKFKLPLAVCEDLREKTASEVEWLRLRCGINYCELPLRCEDSSIVWDEAFYEDIVRIFPQQKLAVQFAILTLYVRR